MQKFKLSVSEAFLTFSILFHNWLFFSFISVEFIIDKEEDTQSTISYNPAYF